MISLKPQTEPYEIELPYGVTVTVKPLTTAGMAAAQAAARRRVESLEAQARERRESGLPLEGLPDLDDDAARDGLFQDLLIKELGIRHIASWSGVEDDPPVTPENVAAILELYPVGERFFQEFTLRQVLLNAAKNASGPSAAGIFDRAEGPDTAKAAAGKARPARKAASA
jgi:hypothetical protein